MALLMAPDAKQALPHCCGASECAGRRFLTLDHLRPSVADFIALGKTSTSDASHRGNLQNPSYADAAHEAGHAIVAHDAGFLIAGLLLDPPTAYVFPTPGADLIDVVAMMLAGPIAERWATQRSVIRPQDEFWLFHIAAVRSGQGGTCDECRAAEAVLSAAGVSGDETIIATLRRSEARAIEVITSDAGTALVSALADELAAKSIISAAAFYATIKNFG